LSEKKQVSDNKFDYLLRKLEKANDVSPAFAQKIDRQIVRRLQKMGVVADLNAKDGVFKKIAPCLYMVRIKGGGQVMAQLFRTEKMGLDQDDSAIMQDGKTETRAVLTTSTGHPQEISLNQLVNQMK